MTSSSQPDLLVPLGIFFLVVVVIRLLNKKATQQLSDEHKARLLDLSQSLLIWRIVPLIVLIFGFALFVHLHPAPGLLKAGVALYLFLIFASSVLAAFFIQKRYRALGFPASYIRLTLLGAALRLLCLLAFFLWLLFPSLHFHP